MPYACWHLASGHQMGSVWRARPSPRVAVWNLEFSKCLPCSCHQSIFNPAQCVPKIQGGKPHRNIWRNQNASGIINIRGGGGNILAQDLSQTEPRDVNGLFGLLETPPVL